MKIILTALCLLALSAAPAGATVTATPWTDTSVPYGAAIATTFTTDAPPLVIKDLGSNYGWSTTDTVCRRFLVKRGTYALDCGAATEVTYMGPALYDYISTYAFTSTAGTTIAAKVVYRLTSDKPLSTWIPQNYDCGRPWMRFYQQLGC